MVPAFGFSVGDFVAVATLVWKISQALSDASEDSKLYRELQLELSAFQGVFVQFQQAVVNAATLPQDHVTRAKEVLAQIERLTNDFNNHMEKFKGLSNSAEKDRTKKSVALRKRVSWTLYGKKPIQQFREAIRGYTAVLTLIMHSLNSQAMQGLHQEMQNGTKQLKLHMDNTFQEPWDQKPIRFQDAIGRRYPVPLEICGTFEGFLDFLQHAFKNDPISNAVQEQSIWLFSPVEGETKTWALITTEDWQSSLYPGMRLSMSVFDGRRVGKGLVSDALLDTPSETEVRLQTPLPLWASTTFPENAKFKLRGPRQRKSLRSKNPCHTHDESLKSRHMNEDTSPQVPSVSYPCPNDIKCGKRFKRQEELFEHLKPTVFTRESLESFPGPDSRFKEFSRQCLFCSGGIFRSTGMVFKKGIELQKSLTGSSSGLASCVAEMVARGDLEVGHLCFKCYGMSGDFPLGLESTPLHEAAANGLINVVEMILKNGGDINLQCPASGTPLHAAARAGNKSTVKFLLDRGGIIDARDEENHTSMYEASRMGRKGTVELLLSRAIGLNAQSEDYDTSLGIAAAGGHEEIVRILLNHGANVNAEVKIYISQWTALHAASEAGHLEVVRLLLDKGANANALCGRRGTALQEASAFRHLEVARLLLDRYANVNSQGGEYGNALQTASEGGHPEMVQLLLDKGADVNAQGGKYGTALQAASEGGHPEIVQLLLDNGADVNAQGGKYGTALQAASASRFARLKIVQLLLDNGANVNAHGGPHGNALKAASDSSKLETVQLLLDRGAWPVARGGETGRNCS